MKKVVLTMLTILALCLLGCSEKKVEEEQPIVFDILSCEFLVMGKTDGGDYFNYIKSTDMKKFDNITLYVYNDYYKLVLDYKENYNLGYDKIITVSKQGNYFRIENKTEIK